MLSAIISAIPNTAGSLLAYAIDTVARCTMGRVVDVEVTAPASEPRVVHARDDVALRRILAVRTLAEAQAIARESLGMPAPVERPAIKPGSAEAFQRDLRLAMEAADAAYPGRWHLTSASIGWHEIPTSLRSYRTERGTMIRIPEAMRLPAARFWPTGSIPHGIGATDVPAYLVRERAPARGRKPARKPAIALAA